MNTLEEAVLVAALDRDKSEVGDYPVDARSEVDSAGEAGDDEAVPLGLLVHDDEWPHGLRCGECHRVLRNGDRYRHRDLGTASDGLAIKLVVCLDCGSGQ